LHTDKQRLSREGGKDRDAKKPGGIEQKQSSTKLNLEKRDDQK